MATKQLVCEGDSMTTVALGYEPSLATELANYSDWSISNIATGGQTVTTMLSDGPSTCDAILDKTKSRNIAVLLGGTNDIYFNQSAANVELLIQRWCKARRLMGYRVIVCTITPRDDFPGTSTLAGDAATQSAEHETRRLAVNTWLRANYTDFADRLVDLGANTSIGQKGDELDPTYYADEVHWSATGNTLAANLIASAIESLDENYPIDSSTYVQLTTGNNAPVVRWNGDENLDGTGDVGDSVGNNDLSWTGSAAYIDAPEGATAGGKSFDLDGVNDYLSSTTAIDTGGSGETTVSFWAFVDTVGDGRRFIESSNPAASTGFMIAQEASDGQLEISSSGSSLTYTIPPLVGLWRHITVRWYYRTIAVFVDGVFQGSQYHATDIGESTAVTVIGARASDGTLKLDGKLHDIRVYNSALSNADIAVLAQGPNINWSDWAGYVSLNPPVSESVSGFTHYIGLNNFPSTFWSNLGAAGFDLRASDNQGNRLPVDIISLVDSGDTGTGLIAVYNPGYETSSFKIRIYSGNPDATTVANTDPFGRYRAYSSKVRGFWPGGIGTDRTSYANTTTNSGSPTVGGVAGPITGSTATDLNGTTQAGVSTVSIPPNAPLSMFYHSNLDNDTAQHGGLTLSDTGTTTNFQFLWSDGVTAGNPIQLSSRATAQSQINIASTGSGFTASTWHMASGVIASIADRRVGLNGANFATLTTSRNPTGLDSIAIGKFLTTTSSLWMDGRISLVELRTDAVSDEFVLHRYNMLSDSDQVDFYGSPLWATGVNSRRSYQQLLIPPSG